jgi:hypothetical protein
MQTKNRKYFIILFLLTFFVLSSNLKADEFNISAKEVMIDKENEILVGKGSVIAEDSEGKVISADKITYEKSREFLLAEGTVKIIDSSKDEAIEFKREIAPTEVVIQKELELINDETGTYYIKGTGERCYTAVVKIKPQVKINQEQQVGIIKEGLDVNGQEF